MAANPDSAANRVQQLKDALEEARALIAFAVKTNRRVEDKIITETMEAMRELGELDGVEHVDYEKEAAFWKAYQDLTQTTKPVSAASIRDSERAAKSRWGTTGTHTVLAALIFIVLATLQIMWVTGTSLRKDLDASDSSIEKAEESLRPTTVQVRDLSLEQASLEFQINAEKKPSAADLAAQKRVKEIEGELRKLQPQAEAGANLLTRLRTQREPVVNLLQGWYEQITWRWWPMRSDNRIADFLNQLEALTRAQEERRTSPIYAKRLSIERELARARDERVYELKRRVDVILNALQHYVFPVLLGLLGALTFILRSLIVRIGDYSYRSSFSDLSFVRISLGMMAGLLGGMLIPSDEGIVKTLSPLALSFLLGYAVEVLFVFLDRIVQAFTTEQQAVK